MTGSLSPNHFNTLIEDLLKDGAKFLCEYSSKHQVISKIDLVKSLLTAACDSLAFVHKMSLPTPF